MNVRSIQTLPRFASRLFLGLTIAFSVSSAAVTADEYSTTCNFTDELCGWVENTSDANLSKPDSAESDNAFRKSITTIVAAVGASTGVSLQQIIEPFAMVGPDIEDSSRMVHEFDQWWELMIKFGKTLSESNTDRALQEVAALEPIDVEFFGPSILVAADDLVTVIGGPNPGIEVTPIDSLVGSAPMIATIDVPYLPYDLSASDIRLRSVFPVTTKAFCVRSRVAQWNPVPMWTEVDRIHADSSEQNSVIGPVDCWMEDLISKVDEWTSPQSPIWTHATAPSIGEKLANLSVGRNQWVSTATKLIASYWPEPIARPSPTGFALLTRANAVLGVSPVGVSPVGVSPGTLDTAQVAEALTEVIVR